MRILVSGATGLIGTAFTGRLDQDGHEVWRLTRRADGNSRSILWEPGGGTLDPSVLEGIDAVIHLAGESVASGRWTTAKKARIRDSRVDGTTQLCEALAAMPRRPHSLLCASAIGYYGSRGDEGLDETAQAGTGFLAEVCVAWERATEPAAAAGIRVVNTRFGIVLSREGGALQAMLTPFRLGLGGRIGDGRQYMSWITLDDAVGALTHVLDNPDVSGPVNVVAPNPVTNEGFTRDLAAALRRPAVMPLPAFAARLALGKKAEELLLASQRVVPARLEGSGFTWAHPDLPAALKHVLES